MGNEDWGTVETWGNLQRKLWAEEGKRNEEE